MRVGLVTIVGLLVLSICGVPNFLALGTATLAAMALGGMPLIVIPQQTFAGINSTAMLAIPFFMLLSEDMSSSKYSILFLNSSNSCFGAWESRYWRMWTKARMMLMLTSMAFSLFKRPDSIATPCSVKA